jgi:hypothetical protein
MLVIAPAAALADEQGSASVANMSSDAGQDTGLAVCLVKAAQR